MASPNPARSWALATAGLLTKHNEHDQTLLGGAAPSPEATASRALLLARDWNVSTRPALLEALTSLARAGDRKIYDDACALVLQHPNAGADGDDTRGAVRFARKHRARIGTKSLLAWDTARLVTLAGWGYLAELLSEDEAWSFILPMAQATQRAYASWDELGKNCLLGRELAKGEWDPPLARAHLAMLEDPESPWRTLPWGLDLSQHGLTVPLQPIVAPQSVSGASIVGAGVMGTGAMGTPAASEAVGSGTLKMPSAPRFENETAALKTKRRPLPFVIAGAALLVVGGVGAAFAFGLGSKKEPPSAPSPPVSASSQIAAPIPSAAPQPSAVASPARPPAPSHAPAPLRPPPHGPRPTKKR